MSALLEKLRKSREGAVVAGRIRYTFRRPTHLEMQSARVGAAEGLARGLPLLAFLTGWAVVETGKQVSELDLGIPGGDPHPLPFDREACADFLSDHIEDFGVVVKAIADAYTGFAGSPATKDGKPQVDGAAETAAKN